MPFVCNYNPFNEVSAKGREGFGSPLFYDLDAKKVQLSFSE
jgi:hypothetical protein